MKPVFDENGLATVPGDMRCFYYDAETSEYTGWSDEYINTGVSMPAYPSWSSKRFTPDDEVLTNFAVPHVAKCILGKTASLSPRFKHHAKAFAFLQIRLDLLADSGEVAAM